MSTVTDSRRKRLPGAPPRWLPGLIAPLMAFGLAMIVSAIVLEVSDNPPGFALSSMWRFGTQWEQLIRTVNRATPLYFAGLAVAIGFHMNLFNIGVEGQYRLAALLAAAVGAAVHLPAPLHVALIFLVAMSVGAAWAGVAAVLKVKRGIHEVISSIMMNTIATGLGAYLLATWFKTKNTGTDFVIKTKELPRSAWFPTLNPVVEKVRDVPARVEVHGIVIVAILVGIGFWVLVWRTRFGFDLRASGINPTAARASGVMPNAMIVRTMMLSGAVAGLIGLPDLLSFFHRYTIDFPTGLGLTGIGIALLGRNHPVGIALGAFLWAFLDRSAQILDLNDVPREIVTIMQGVTVLSAVVAFEIVRRWTQTLEVKAAARASEGASTTSGTPTTAVPA